MSAEDARVLACGLGGAAVFLAAQVAAFRYGRPATLKRAFVPAFALGTAACAALWAASGWSGGLPGGSLAFSLCGLSTLLAAEVFGVSEAALRVRLLAELARRPDRSAGFEEICAAYGALDLMEDRLRRLTGAGYLLRDGTGYRPGPLGLLRVELAALRVLSALHGAGRRRPAGSP